MTEFTAEIVEVQDFLEAHQIPTIPLPRTGNEAWLYRTQPFDFANPVMNQEDWTLVRQGDLVPIPLIPYRSAGVTLPALLLGAMDIIQRYVLQHREVLRTHILIGNPVEDLRPAVEAYRFWVGFAVQIH